MLTMFQAFLDEGLVKRERGMNPMLKRAFSWGGGLGCDFEKVVERISILFHVEKDYITGRGRQKDRVRAGDLLCCRTVAEFGMPMVDLAGEFDMTPAAVSYAVQRGENMAKERGLQLEP